MAITITNPQSRVVARAATLLISWTSDYPYNAYEIQYREAGATAWSTFGRVASTATSASISLSSLLDGCEYHYRIVLYSNNTTSGTTIYNGSQMSMAYSLVVTPAAKLGILKAKYGSKMVEVPVYTDSNTKNQIKIGVHGARGHILLGADEDPTATVLKVDHPKAGNSSVLAEKAAFRYSGVPATAYIRQDTCNTKYSYYRASKYNRTYQVGYYVSSYTYIRDAYSKSYVYSYYYQYATNKYYCWYFKGLYYICWWGQNQGEKIYYHCDPAYDNSDCARDEGSGTIYMYGYYNDQYYYIIPSYARYYNYYRYYTYYKHTYYSYTTTYHYI